MVDRCPDCGKDRELVGHKHFCVPGRVPVPPRRAPLVPQEVPVEKSEAGPRGKRLGRGRSYDRVAAYNEYMRNYMRKRRKKAKVEGKEEK
jgi:hypothetical protein